ncbi:hypothetical protein AB833_19190 [Chromatiales bacterium (ex Bugula neritina AB1)]|nr:hypothetical protein AB833_19190 [Chromatiales bacterium (ex Bugula neritina AB1)]
MVDPIATYNFQTLAVQPAIEIVPGAAETWVAVIPSICEINKPFTLRIKVEDTWGNPTNKAKARLYIKVRGNIKNLPEHIDINPGKFAHEITGLVVDEEGDFDIVLSTADGTLLTKSNPARAMEKPTLKYYWADLHGQSDETLGTNSAADYFSFGRDMAFLDACAHQGNDFQMTESFWQDLNQVTAEFNEPGRYVTLPGYEWSGNTALGGDRNVYFPAEGRTMRRSSHALIESQHDIDTDCHTAAELFESFAKHNEWDVICFAHCGGRYADITMAHDGRFEKSVEVHSAWGTFEWLVQDAFKCGYRVGIIGNSDGHKGRPGASYPGAGWFGAVGGLTCYIMPDLSRETLIDSIKSRHHYATNGGPSGRIIMDLSATFEQPGTVYQDDPALFANSQGVISSEAMMGDIVHLPSGDLQLSLSVTAASPVRRIDLFNGLDHLECHRPYSAEDLGSRIGVLWEGAEYRGRFRSVVWDGTARFDIAKVSSTQAINFFNRDKTLEVSDESIVKWQSVTTGNFAGFIATLQDGMKGSIEIDTPLVKETIALDAIGLEDTVLDASATLPRALRLFRLPDENPNTSVAFEQRLSPLAGRDNPYYVRVTLEDGTQAWTSPVYILRSIA